MISFTFPAIGTTWQIDIDAQVSIEKESEIFFAIQKRIDDFDKTYSRFRSDSLVTKMSQESGEFVLPEDAKKLFELYYELYTATEGLFSPFVGQILVDAGYDADYSLTQKKELVAPPLWEQVIRYDAPVLFVKQTTLLDFGAGGKGYLVDLVAEVIESFDMVEYCIDAGGDILRKGRNTVRIGLENPRQFDEVIGVYTLGNGSLCGSAHNRRSWGDFTHIINPATLSSPKEIVAVWVYAQSALLADSIATCLFFVSPKKLQGIYDFEYLIMRDNNLIEKSSGFSAEIFIHE